jgi:hypothetical protein
MKQDREFRAMCKEVAEEFEDLSTEQVMEIVSDSFEFANKHISSGSLTPVYFQYLGRFLVSPGRIDWLKKKKDERKQRKLLAQGDSGDAPEVD